MNAVKTRRFWILALIFPGILYTTGFLPLAVAATTPTTPNQDGYDGPASIAEERMVSLGGWAQHVLIRGTDRSNPLLVFLHGGPGTPETPLLRRYNSELEQHFVVVYWEQRGAGRSYSRALDMATLTIPQLLADLDELVDHLRVEFGERKVLLVAHSWGTALGTMYAASHPEKVNGYVGIGQKSNPQASELEGYQWVLEQARIAGDSRAIRRLEAIGPPPYDLESTQVQRAYLWRYGGAFHDGRSFPRVIWECLASDETSLRDLIWYQRGQRVSLETMWPSVLRLDFCETHTRFQVPMYFLLGRYDHQVSANLASRYFERVDAPHKEIVWFEESAHNPPFEEADKFNAEILRIGRSLGVLPADGQRSVLTPP